VPTFCYIISDITPSLREIRETLDAFPTPDNQGYYGFQKTFGIYYEVSDYDKLLGDVAAGISRTGKPDPSHKFGRGAQGGRRPFEIFKGSIIRSAAGHPRSLRAWR
jgi:hypothetical protein